MRQVEVDKCWKVINVMRCLSGVGWGANTVKYKYVALIRSRIDCGSVAYGSAARSVLAGLDQIQARALRVCLGAVRTSPVCALQVEAPLETAGSKFPAIPERAQRESSNKKGVRGQLGERESTKVKFWLDGAYSSKRAWSAGS